MKCIKSIRETKEIKFGEIKRVDDKTAHNMVGSTWIYTSKSEWKQIREVPTENKKSDDSKKEKTQSKKAENRAKIKEKQRN
jgi:hypothetical protein